MPVWTDEQESPSRPSKLALRADCVGVVMRRRNKGVGMGVEV